MKKRVLILIIGVIFSCGLQAGILTSGFAARYMMLQMIELLNQKKIDKMTFPKNDGPDHRSSSSIHFLSSSTFWRFDYFIYEDNEILQMRFFGTKDNDVSRIFNTIKRYGTYDDDDILSLGVHMYMYDKTGTMIASVEGGINTFTNGLREVSIFLSMNRDNGWNDILAKHDISCIRIEYGGNSFNIKLIDDGSPYSTIEQIRQLSFWVRCPEDQINKIAKEYDVWAK